MNRFYTDNIIEAEGYVLITGDDVNHISNVLRLKTGDRITVSSFSSSDAKEYICVISEIDREYVKAGIIDICGNYAELPADIVLYQGFPKGDKMDTIIQKCVELGVSRIVPVIMRRTISRPDIAKQKKRVLRYNAISEAASKQSRRDMIPEVSDFMFMKEAVEAAKQSSTYILLPYEEAEGMELSREVIYKVVGKIKSENTKSDISLEQKKPEIAVFIGPEGGFTTEEVKALKNASAEVISLGHRILRTETAGMMVMSILSFLLDDLEVK